MTSSATRRLFLAIDVDDASRREIGTLIGRIRTQFQPDSGRDREPIRWVEPAKLHLTLRFLGSTAESKWQELQSVLERPLAISPFELRFDRVGTFPERGAPRVIWLGVSEGATETRRVSEELEQRLRAVGMPADPQPLHPHLTIGRFRAAATRSNRAALRGVTVEPLGHVRVDHVILYESRLSSSGSRYEPLLRVDFNR